MGVQALAQLAYLVEVEASGRDIWAVGSSLTGGVTSQTLAEQWNGTQCQIVPSADPAAGSDQLSGVAGTIAGQPLWAVGFGTGSGMPQFSTLVETNTG
jgi:hypothetical protein